MDADDVGSHPAGDPAEGPDALAAWWATPARAEDASQASFDLTAGSLPDESPAAPPDPLEAWWAASGPAPAPAAAPGAVTPPGLDSDAPDLVKVWRWIGPAPVVAAGPLRRLTPDGWAPADYAALTSTVRAAQFFPAADAFTSYAQIFAAFLVQTGRVTPMYVRRWGQWAPDWWAWAYQKCMAALSAWATAVGQLVPADPVCLERAAGWPPLPGVTAECTGCTRQSRAKCGRS